MGDETKDAEWDFCIRIAGNTGPRVLIALWQKGYAIQHYSIEKSDGNFQYEYEAKKDGRLFSATSPEELLGLVALWETRGEDWCDTTEEEWNRYEKLMDESRIYDEEGRDVTDED